MLALGANEAKRVTEADRVIAGVYVEIDAPRQPDGILGEQDPIAQPPCPEARPASRLWRGVASGGTLAPPDPERPMHPWLTRFFAFEFPAIGSARFPNATTQGGFCHVFYALLLRR